jgi:carboxypeptidase Taq
VESKLNELKTRLLEVNDLEAAAALLNWDQTTYMPPGGAAARGRQLATLGQLAHEKFTDAAIGRLLDELLPYEESLPYDSDDASLLRVTRRDYERAVRCRPRSRPGSTPTAPPPTRPGPGPGPPTISRLCGRSWSRRLT